MGCLFDKDSNVIYDSGKNNLRDSLIYRDAPEDIKRRQSFYQEKIDHDAKLLSQRYAMTEPQPMIGSLEYSVDYTGVYSRPRSPFTF